MKKTTTTAIRSGLMLLLCLISLAFFSVTAKAQSSCKAGFTFTTKDSTALFFPDSSKKINKVYRWSFGNGNYGSAMPYGAVQYNYSMPGIYMACLAIKDTITNCRDTFCALVEISMCKASFSSMRTNNRITFYNHSFKTKNTKYIWDFGDLTTSNQINPVHTYSKAGTYLVTLVMQDTITKCADTFKANVYPVDYINSCKAGFTYTVDGNILKIRNTSVRNETAFCQINSVKGGIYSWFNKNSDSLNFWFQNNGKYDICLVIYDSFINCRDTFCTEVEIKHCKAAFYHYRVGKTFHFINQSSFPNAVFHWDFGDGNTSNAANPQHTYNSNGTYKVTLKMTNSATNCTDSTSKIISLLCTADFGYKHDGKKVTFYDSSITPNGHTRYWVFHHTYNYPSFTHVASSTDKNPTINFPAGGSYYAILYIRDTIYHCDDSIKKLITIPECRAYFHYLQDYEYVDFYNRSTDTANTSFTWDFGDGTGVKSTQINTRHRYAKAGSYKVKLVMRENINNCMDSMISYIQIYPRSCHNEFGYTISGNEVSFIPDTAYYYGNNFGYNYHTKFATFHWDFGDSTTSSLKLPQHKYNDTGKYTVCLTIKDAYCTRKECKEINVTSLAPTYSISGEVYTGTYLADSMGVEAYLIGFNGNDSSLSIIDYYSFDFTRRGFPGTYYFDNLEPGKYFVKAALKKTSKQYANYLPTYADSALKWADAREIVISNSNVTARVDLRQGNNPGGKGFISGKISEGANKREGDPLENIQVMLLDENLKPVTYTYSDGSGSFSFSNIPFGRFQVYTEVVGVRTIPSWVTITEADPKEDRIEIKISKKLITTSIRTDEDLQSGDRVNIFPNPVQNQLNVVIDAPVTNTASLNIYDCTGRKIISETIMPSANSQTININTTQLPAGIYLMQLQLKNDITKQFKFVK